MAQRWSVDRSIRGRSASAFGKGVGAGRIVRGRLNAPVGRPSAPPSSHYRTRAAFNHVCMPRPGSPRWLVLSDPPRAKQNAPPPQAKCCRVGSAGGARLVVRVGRRARPTIRGQSKAHPATTSSTPILGPPRRSWLGSPPCVLAGAIQSRCPGHVRLRAQTQLVASSVPQHVLKRGKRPKGGQEKKTRRPAQSVHDAVGKEE